jgi:hypothetical protein
MIPQKVAPFEIREVPDPEGGLILELRANGLRLATARAPADTIEAMGKARDDVRRYLEDALSNLPLKPELERQIFGYWFGPDEDIPSEPSGYPTGAVLLPESSATLDRVDDVSCLDLVPVQNYWLVLSELGRHTYRHTSGLMAGEVWKFVPVRDAAGSWPVAFEVTLAESLSPSEVGSRYGFEASTRVRADALAVQLRLRRQS